MSYVHQDTLVMCFLSSDPTLRAYETDLLGELDRKGLGLLKVVIGEDIPVELIRGHDVAIECQGLESLRRRRLYGDLCHCWATLGFFFAALARDCARIRLSKTGYPSGGSDLRSVLS
jgi:hypothetical protein